MPDYTQDDQQYDPTLLMPSLAAVRRVPIPLANPYAMPQPTASMPVIRPAAAAAPEMPAQQMPAVSSLPVLMGQPNRPPMPSGPDVGPAQTRAQQVEAQGMPKLAGWRKALDVAGQILAPRVEETIPGTPGNYRARFADAENQAKPEEQRNQTAFENARQAQTDELSRENIESEMADRAAQERQRDEAAASPKQPNLTAEEATIHDLMTGNSGGPQINPDTQKPYTYLEAYGAIKQAADTKNPPKRSDSEQAISDWMAANNKQDTPANRDAARKALKTEDRPAPEPTDSDKAISDYLAANKLPNTAENRDKARTALATQKAEIPANVKSAAAANTAVQDVLDKEQEAQQFAAEKTGPGDIGLILAMVEATRPKAGFRMTQTEWQQILHARSTLGDVNALINKVEDGQLLTDTQRQQMLSVIRIVADMARKRQNPTGQSNGGTSAPQDFGDAGGKPEGSTGTLDGKPVVVRKGRIVSAQ